jgi:cytochrome b
MSDKTYVWDPLVRLFHWTLVAAFLIAYLTGDEENALHIYSGYYILGLVAFRILWGFIGTKYSRFSSFNLSPRALIDYLAGLFKSGKGKDYSGHNPAGSWMAIVMLLSLTATGLSGLKVYGEEGHGPLALQTTANNSVATGAPERQTGFIKVSRDEYEHRYEDRYEHHEEHESHDKYKAYKEYDSESDDGHERGGEGEEYWEEIHEFFANFTVLLVIVHVLGVIVSSSKHGQNLVRPMITGYKS